MDYANFFIQVGITTTYLIVIGLAGYGGYVLVIGFYKAVRCPIKYNILRKKYDAKDVKMIMDVLGDRLFKADEPELIKKLLLSNKCDYKKATELAFIYNKMLNIHLKGGNNNNVKQ